MTIIKDHLQKLQNLLEIEQAEEKKLFIERINKVSIHERCALGHSWYPVAITDWYYDKLEKVTVEVQRQKNLDKSHEFNTGRLVEVFSKNDQHSEEKATGIIASIRGQQAKIVLRNDEYPDWMKNGRIGINLLYDETSYSEMKRALKILLQPEFPRTQHFLDLIHGGILAAEMETSSDFLLPSLNKSQNIALGRCLAAEDISIIHGPPGTGKTRTLIEVICQSLKNHKQLLVCAPSNSAVDLLVDNLQQRQVKVLRIGNPAKINDDIQAHSLSWQVSQHPDFSLIKKLKKQSQEYKNMASKYKRTFGAAERAQRKALFDESWKLQKEAFQIEDYITESLINEAQIIATTLVGSSHHLVRDRKYPICFIDEAGQALEAATWIPMLKSHKVILAGDHLQLPPTVKSAEAARQGLAISLFEKIMAKKEYSTLLTTQYRMNGEIMAFPSSYFYEGALIADDSVNHNKLSPEDLPIEFIDTAGCSFCESTGQNASSSRSLINKEEAGLLWKHLLELAESMDQSKDSISHYSIGIISPYKAQVDYLKTWLSDFPYPNEAIKIHTVDGFQGQEKDIIYISLVRSNEDQEIGFLKDYRRMNVALTRAKKKLVIIGDSATLGHDPFYNEFLRHCENNNAYKSAWEFIDY